VTEPIDIGPASTSVSFASTATAVAPSSSPSVALSSIASGGSSTAPTVIETLAGADVSEPSLTVKLNVSGPS